MLKDTASLGTSFHLSFINHSSILSISLTMENPRALLTRRLPTLTQLGGTSELLVSNERLAANYMHIWPDFEQQALEACNSSILPLFA